MGKSVAWIFGSITCCFHLLSDQCQVGVISSFQYLSRFYRCLDRASRFIDVDTVVEATLITQGSDFHKAFLHLDGRDGWGRKVADAGGVDQCATIGQVVEASVAGSVLTKASGL